MPIPTVLSTSKVSSNDSKGRKATDLFRAAYDKAGLDEASAQLLNENRSFPVKLLKLIKDLSTGKTSQENKILQSEGQIVFPARVKMIDPNEFFKRGRSFSRSANGLLYSGSFYERLLPALKPVASTPERIYEIWRLKKGEGAWDREIRNLIPNPHFSNWEDIVSLIEMYPNGKRDELLFYLKGVDGQVMALNVFWDTCGGNRSWHLECRGIDEHEPWHTSYNLSRIILFPANASV